MRHRRPACRAGGLAAGLLAAATILAAAPAAPAQDPSTTPPGMGGELSTEPLPAGFDPVAEGLEREPRSFESQGLRIHLPRGSSVRTERHQGGTSVLIQEKAEAATWSIRLQELRSTISTMMTPTAAGQVAEHLTRLTKSGVDHRILRNQPVTYRGASGQLCYLEQKTPDGQAFVTGWLIMPTDPGRFVVLSVFTLPEHFGRVEALLEKSFSTIALRSERQIASTRSRLLAGGAALLASIDEDRLRGLVGGEEWYRIYREQDSQGQPVEVGYSMVSIAEARRGALTPERSEREYDASERENGLLVTVRSRVVIDRERDHYLDWIGLYWMAWDQSTESWSVRATQRRAESEASESETGVRTRQSTGDPAPRLTVIRSTSRSLNRTPFEWSVPHVYLGQGLGWIIGRLKPTAMVDGRAEVAFYSYDNTTDPTVTLRTDRWDALPGGGWEHTRRLATSETGTVTTYDREGRFVGSRGGDGSRVDPIDIDRLQRLWASKGLRLGGRSR